MPSRDQVVAVLRSGATYEQVAERLHIPAGQAYLIATGLPADGSDALGPEFLARKAEFLLEGSSQHLANPPTEVPTENPGVREWARQRAAGDAALRQAAERRTAEPPPVQQRSAGDDSEDVLDVLGHDHNQVKYLQEQLEAIPGVTKGGSTEQQQRRASIVDMMRIRLAQHETAEEQYFWPAVRALGPEGDRIADEAIEQETTGESAMDTLDKLRPEDEEFETVLSTLISDARAHIAYEEAHAWPLLETTLTRQQAQELGDDIVKAKKMGPTRPHPGVPPQPGPMKAAGPVAAAADKLRDAITGRGKDS